MIKETGRTAHAEHFRKEVTNNGTSVPDGRGANAPDTVARERFLDREGQKI